MKKLADTSLTKELLGELAWEEIQDCRERLKTIIKNTETHLKENNLLPLLNILHIAYIL